MRPARGRGIRLGGLVVVIVLAGAVLTGCLPASLVTRALTRHVAQEIAAAPFYRVPSPLPAGAPGELIRSEPIPTVGPSMKAWRILYHSRDLNGADIAVSGTVVAPTTPAPAGGRPIVAWGHPTTGAAPRCAPSVGLAPLDLIEGLGGLIADGYVVAATDYPGMGAPGPSSYLLGVSEGDSMLDAARAARQIPDADAGTRLLIWGHSQGGQAALFAGQLAASYAPELQLKAVAVAAPAAELGTLLNDDIGDVSGVTIGSYAFAAFQAAYATRYPGLSLGSILTPAGAAATPGMAELCLFGQNAALHRIATSLIGGYLLHDPSTAEPWATLLRENSAGASPIGAPVLVAQGLKDGLVKPSATTDYVTSLCAAGQTVDYRQYPDATHGTIAYDAGSAVRAWFSAALDGGAMTLTCSGTP
ncbi:MAG TPA: lipase family protein [Pseudolysinimonas sp.]|jgi:pimeloyl-ACP methyl ester carboxylesterase